MSLAERLSGSQFLRFVVTGGLAAGANILSRLALSQIVSFETAVVVAYLVGMTVAFILARLFVFDASGRSVQGEFLRFGLVNLVALLQVWLVSVGLARYLFPALGFAWHAETVAHVIGVLSPVVTSYYGHKKFSFGDGKA